MLSQLSRYIDQLKLMSISERHRYLVVVEGELDWAYQISDIFISKYQHSLWCGDNPPSDIRHASFRQAQHWLGQETDCVIINCHDGIVANVLGAISGTIKAGGALLLVVPPGWLSSTHLSLFSKRLAHLVLLSDAIILRQSSFDQEFVLPSLVPSYNNPVVYVDNSPRCCLTSQQYDAVSAIIKVMTGHRKRPLVLSADRGRGKSAALGIAAAELMSSKKINIAITAPSIACAATVFEMATERLPNFVQKDKYSICFDGSNLDFVAPDRICSLARNYDFILVDEAAAIPAPLLSSLLDCHNRLVFASTIHGYEGTGRGFAIKFRATLDAKMPQWRRCHIDEAIRWGVNDPLEQWIFNALLLNAEPASHPSIDNSQIKYQLLSISQLSSNHQLLSELVGLLINAHYQTSPNDIQLLLDDPTLALFVALSNGSIIGCCMISREGDFDDELAQLVMQGKRRPQGHLLPQSIAAHLGFTSAATQKCFRIIRIAVIDNLQQQGIGSGLLNAVVEFGKEQKIDYIGTSFGAVSELVDFWVRANFMPIRLGVSKDAASGNHSLLCVCPLSTDANIWYDDAVRLFEASFTSQRVEQFKYLDSELFTKIYRLSNCHPISYGLPKSVIDRQLTLYANGALGYDFIVASFETWLSLFIKSDTFIFSTDVGFAVAKVLQKQSWDELVINYKFTSKKYSDQYLRQFVKNNFKSLASYNC